MTVFPVGPSNKRQMTPMERDFLRTKGSYETP